MSKGIKIKNNLQGTNILLTIRINLKVSLGKKGSRGFLIYLNRRNKDILFFSSTPKGAWFLGLLFIATAIFLLWVIH
jgi:hypothetical protein